MIINIAHSDEQSQTGFEVEGRSSVRDDKFIRMCSSFAYRASRSGVNLPIAHYRHAIESNRDGA